MTKFIDYVKEIKEKEGLMFTEKVCNNGIECYENDELRAASQKSARDYSFGKVRIRFKNESNLSDRIQSSLIIEKRELNYGANDLLFKFSLTDGCHASIYISEASYKENYEQTVEIYPFRGRIIKIKVLHENKNVKVLIYRDEEVIGEIGIEELSAESIIAKISELMIGEFDNQELLNKFDRLFEIAKHILYLRVPELSVKWIKQVTKPVKVSQERVREIDEEIAKLQEERNKEVQYLLSMDGKLDDLLYLVGMSDRINTGKK